MNNIVRKILIFRIIKIIAIISILFMMLIPSLYCDSLQNTQLTKDTNDRIVELIKENYKIFEANLIYLEMNDTISDNLFELIDNAGYFSQSDFDVKAMATFNMLYKEVHLGSLGDSNDLRRQSMRAAFCYSTIGLCSERNYSYYLNLALASISENGRPIEFLENFYLAQLLLNIYIYDLKGSEYGIRMSMKSYDEYINNSAPPSEDIARMIAQIKSEIGESKK